MPAASRNDRRRRSNGTTRRSSASWLAAGANWRAEGPLGLPGSPCRMSRIGEGAQIPRHHPLFRDAANDPCARWLSRRRGEAVSTANGTARMRPDNSGAAQYRTPGAFQLSNAHSAMPNSVCGHMPFSAVVQLSRCTSRCWPLQMTLRPNRQAQHEDGEPHSGDRREHDRKHDLRQAARQEAQTGRHSATSRPG